MDGIRGRKGGIRRHPGVRGKRPDKAEYRRAEAMARQAAYDSLTLEQKIMQLPKDGAKKQRAKLEAQFNKQNAKVVVE